jgi:hypothetical protein
MKEFINPKSMLTPGVAGSLMMFLGNGICCQFPEIPIRYLALFLSFLIGTIVWFSETRGKSPLLQKTVYWVLNSLVIFVVGFGTANLAADAAASKSKATTPHVQSLSFVSRAFAQNASPQGVPAAGSGQSQADPGAQDLKVLEKKLEKEQAENLRLKKELESVQKEKAMSLEPQSEKPSFFKRW